MTSISVVLPCFNEVRHGYLERILHNLLQQEGDKEIIAVVSPSSDGTETLIARITQEYAEVKLILAPATNRAQRLNYGIQASRSEIVLLHHPATLLPLKALVAIATAIEESAIEESESLWGGFQHSFDLEHGLLKFTSWYSNFVRVNLKGIVYLDHCIFATRKALDMIGGVPDLDIFEDTVLSERLLSLGRPVLLDGVAITSARRFRQRGVVKQALLNQALKAFYHFGIDPKYMNRLYEQQSSINVNYESQSQKRK